MFSERHREPLLASRAGILAIALLASLSACGSDATAPATTPAVIPPANFARIREVTTTEIIPVVLNVNASSVYGQATAINEAGVVAGWRRTPSGVSAFIWKDGVLTELGTFFRPVAITRQEDIVGNRDDGTIVIWRRGAITTLTPPSGFTYMSATSMNERGQIVGSMGKPGIGSHAMLWNNGTFVDLGTLGGTSSFATSINKHGQIVGYSYLPGDQQTHGFLWDRGVMTDLGTLYGGSSQANAINDHGDIAGITDATWGIGPLPFILRKGVMAPLFPGVQNGWYGVTGISNAGHVIGYRATLNPDPGAFVWLDGVAIDLAVSPSYALGVNSSGEIAGYEAGPTSGASGAYLWIVGRRLP